MEGKITLVLEPKPKIKMDDKGEENLMTIKLIGYNYDECIKALRKIIILDAFLTLKKPWI